MRYFIGAITLTTLFFGAFFILTKNAVFEINGNFETIEKNSIDGLSEIKREIINQNSDIEPQKPLANPPEIIKAVYLTGWSAGSDKKIGQIIDLIKNTELNAVVIDVKDYSGYVAYDIDLPEIKKYGAKKIMISKINSLLKKLHDENIYVIARITVFQDPILAKARPDLAVHSRARLAQNTELTPSTLWSDRKKLFWIDPSSKEAWDYNIAVAKDASNRGFDELNFDYIRFASDGDLKDMIFPFWQKTPSEAETKRAVIRNFFKYLREQLPDIKISADLFGLVTVQKDDLGIGQIIEDAYAYFDYVSPMVYPSHYTNGFLNYKNPAQYPYEVVKYSMEKALNRITTSTSSKLRPWLQDFDLGAEYDAKMVKKQIQAIYDAASSTPELTNGWMLWNPANVYTRGALQVSE